MTTPAVPDGDFASARFDRDTGVPPSHLLVIYSTPRSGSTMLCDLVDRTGLCTPHEYFQPYQYRPAMSDRWGVEADDDAGYVAALCRYRTGQSGWLGINLHGHHLDGWSKARTHLPASITAETHVFVSRRDKIAQAVSYFIAAEGGAWSTAFEPGATPAYDYEGIARKRHAIVRMESQIETFLDVQEIRPARLVYEEIARDPAPFLTLLPVSEIPGEAGIQRQDSPDKIAFAQKFRRDDGLLGRVRRKLAGR